ncbi:subtilisin-like protease [Tripterygium wilfordii]|uniref:subtilisin-like protease n=1 Tax=Tripterygium wilfordii TaxID=458696 RepID=UPI0018F83370|nr:subtilisin-like protease [Tripterygium wilfordii]
MLFFYLVSLNHKFSFSQAIISNHRDAFSNDEGSLKTYIVKVKKPEGEEEASVQSENLDSWYNSFLPVTDSSLHEQQRMVYSYRHVATGFAAKLTADEVKDMEKKDGFVSAQPQRKLHLQTTHTPDFLGLRQGPKLWQKTNHGKGVIIAVLDTGITPGHPSFSANDVPRPPAKWEVKCEESICNNKLIGARNFQDRGPHLLDTLGHGTHTASTAAGNFVEGANLFGIANGTAAGMAPLAHLAIYKVCGGDCLESDILAGMDAAINDGVDVISMSLGGLPMPFYKDNVAIGAFAATQRGIFVSCAAGNWGPKGATVTNVAPWILTVGASTVDRSYRATVVLGNGEEFDGESFYQPKDFSSELLSLVYPGSSSGNEKSKFCAPGSLADVYVKGKIVLCEKGGKIQRTGKGQVVKDAGGAAMILINDDKLDDSIKPNFHLLPASLLRYKAGLRIKDYIASTPSPMAKIVFKGPVFGLPSAPMVAEFSSRGPNLVSPGILKPDIIGPGVDILAAWISANKNQDHSNKNRKPSFQMISGTSMSCPHLSGIAALLKSSHPHWSPAAIKSAIITTAYTTNRGNNPITDENLVDANIFDIGAGHVDPSRANDPGLIYDIQTHDYISYLCGLDYSDDQVTTIVRSDVKCSKILSIPEAELNYPSFSVNFGSSPQTYNRTVTNVGPADASYTPRIVAPTGVLVSVTPGALVFQRKKQKSTYAVTFSMQGEGGGNSFGQGYLEWVSATHTVRSPIVVTYKRKPTSLT